MSFYSGERIGLFIDGANLHASARQLGFNVDYKKLLRNFSRPGHLIRANYYTALAENQYNSPIRPLVNWLGYNGYTLVTKSAKEFIDTDGRQKIKGNMDIELVVDALEMS